MKRTIVGLACVFAAFFSTAMVHADTFDFGEDGLDLRCYSTNMEYNNSSNPEPMLGPGEQWEFEFSPSSEPVKVNGQIHQNFVAKLTKTVYEKSKTPTVIESHQVPALLVDYKGDLDSGLSFYIGDDNVMGIPNNGRFTIPKAILWDEFLGYGWTSQPLTTKTAMSYVCAIK